MFLHKLLLILTIAPHFTHEETEAWGGKVTCQGHQASSGEVWFGNQPLPALPLTAPYFSCSSVLPNTIVSYPRAESTSLGVMGSHVGRGVPFGLPTFFSHQSLGAAILKAQ